MAHEKHGYDDHATPVGHEGHHHKSKKGGHRGKKGGSSGHHTGKMLHHDEVAHRAQIGHGEDHLADDAHCAANKAYGMPDGNWTKEIEFGGGGEGHGSSTGGSGMADNATYE